MKHVTRNELMSLLNIKCPSTVFRDIAADQPVEHHGWTVMRSKITRGYQYIIIEEGLPLDVPNGHTAAELSSMLGFSRDYLYRPWPTSHVQRIKGHIIERLGVHQGSIRFRVLDKMPDKAKTRALPQPKFEASVRECAVCACALTPRRTVRINGYEHCVPCNRRAFVDGCYETRKKLGI